MKPLNHLSAFMTTIAVVSFLPVPCPLAAQDIAAKNGLSVLRDTTGHYRIAASDETKEDPFAVQVIPPSPQSAIYRKYLDHAIDESTGIPDISIPLFEIRLKELTIPVTLIVSVLVFYVLGISINTVRTHKSRAYKVLRIVLSNQWMLF